MTRILAVTDWTVNPHAVVAALMRRGPAARWSIVVPAWLHGLDWAGDPHAAEPCAETALLTIHQLVLDAGLDVELAVVGDPDPTAAVQDACAVLQPDAILLCTRRRRFGHPLDLAHRLHRITGLPTGREHVPIRRRGHCAQAAA
jgi:hypothetical protein